MTVIATPRFIQTRVQTLVEWYHSVKRPLPWRTTRDPYRIWISEVMLQQTTVAAVVPYYEKFMLRFPDLESLAESSLDDVLEHWAGLGYYSRARNLHRAARSLSERMARGGDFPKTHVELLEYPGFGDYTARAVASLAFGEKTGVLDGNVIRVLSRIEGLTVEWWKTTEKKRLQSRADAWASAKGIDANEINQAMMELGATVCTPRAPSCLLCPMKMSCAAFNVGMVPSLPLERPRKSAEIWLWKPEVLIRNGSVLLIQNDYAPFLKGHWIPPGTAAKQAKKPAGYHLRGSVTHHDIHVQLVRALKRRKGTTEKATWVELHALKSKTPSSLVRKTIAHAANKENWQLR